MDTPAFKIKGAAKAFALAHQIVTRAHEPLGIFNFDKMAKGLLKPPEEYIIDYITTYPKSKKSLLEDLNFSINFFKEEISIESSLLASISAK